MADRRFFENAGPFALSVLAEIAEAELAEGSDGSRTFSDVAPLDAAGPDDVSFLDNRRYLDQFRESRAGACIVDPELADRLLLFNEEDPDPSDPLHKYGVDEGEGWLCC